jgi:multicomponent Na+:H+ antiporter subunit E
MKHTISILLLLALAWWVLSGHATPLLLSLGLGSVLLVGWLERRLQRAEGAGHPLHLSWGLLAFWAWLLREIVLANLQVLRLVLARRPALSPRVLRVQGGQPSELARVVLGNAITLTPGTVTLDLDGDTVVVHALTAASAADVEAGSIARRVPPDVQDLPGPAR